MSEHVACPWCGGAGLLAPVECERCDGRGNVPTVVPWPEMTATMGRVTCSECPAVGRVEAEWRLGAEGWWAWAVCRACGCAERSRATLQGGQPYIQI